MKTPSECERLASGTTLSYPSIRTERPKAVGQSEGVIVKEVPEVSFVSVHYAARSHMAAALPDSAAPGMIHVERPVGALTDELVSTA
jgi:hypothetical protein